MADVAPEFVPKAGLAVMPPTQPSSTATSNQNAAKRLTVDTFSPVTQFGSYEYDRVIKQGPVLKRTRRTKSWKPVHIVLRATQLFIYKNEKESKLRHAVTLSELTAVARQKDPKRQSKHVFGLFSPSRNFHLEAATEKEAQEWVEAIRLQARMDQKEEEMYLASPGGASTSYRGFERSIDANISPLANEVMSGYSSSDAEGMNGSQPLPRARDRTSISVGHRKSSAVDYSGAEHGSYSDFSDWGGGTTARMSALSLSYPDPRPSTSSTQQVSSVYGQAPGRPSIGARNPSQMSGLNLGAEEGVKKPSMAEDPERVLNHGWVYLLKSKSGVRQWKKVWMVLRPKQLTVYKNEEEYTALILLPFASIIDAVELDDISRTKTACMQILTEERNYRFCAVDEDSLARWLGSLKSLLAKRKVKAAQKQAVAAAA
ncbi:putative pleckstrin domain, PH-like domain superfamily [Septoria linicola]|nr:putative pleckstrin domain, PH-like domain superfamily [Septoria linicola]